MSITLTARRRASSKSMTSRVKKKVHALSRAAAMKMTWVVLVLQGAVLLTFTLVPAKMPPKLPMMDLLWAASRKADFYPLVLLLVCGPVLSMAAWTVRGTHRALTVLGWMAFLTVVFAFHLERVKIMLRVLAWEYL